MTLEKAAGWAERRYLWKFGNSDQGSKQSQRRSLYDSIKLVLAAPLRTKVTALDAILCKHEGSHLLRLSSQGFEEGAVAEGAPLCALSSD